VVSNPYCVVFCFAFLLLVYPMLPVSLDCPFLIASLVFFNVYLVLRGLESCVINTITTEGKDEPSNSATQSVKLLYYRRENIFSIIHC
jgi:hypothetical protein